MLVKTPKFDKIYSELQKKSLRSEYICLIFLNRVKCKPNGL